MFGSLKKKRKCKRKKNMKENNKTNLELINDFYVISNS